MNILMIGCGYVGLVTGASFAKMGHHVFFFDCNQQKIASLQNLELPIYEPGLQEIVVECAQQERIQFFSKYPPLDEIDIAFFCVATPENPDGSCNTDYLFAAANTLGEHLRAANRDKSGATPLLVVNKSTAPVGTTNTLKKLIEKASNQAASFAIASNPEFLKQGSAVYDCMKPDRIILGVENPKAEEILRLVYAPFMLSRDRLIAMDIASAELTKYAANAMLSSRISFMNEMADIAEALGADIGSIRKGIGSDSRIGVHFLYAGIGFGGSCFPKDLSALMHMAKTENISVPMLRATQSINERQKKRTAQILERYFAAQGGLEEKVVALWGLSFKPDTDDIREAPSLTIIEELQKKGARLQVFDPAAMQNIQRQLPSTNNITFCKNALEAAKNVDAICLVTEWKEFRSIDFSKIPRKKDPILLLDGRNQYNQQELTRQGFIYIGIGTSTNQID
ncbi:MAG: UDP-glucose/GDP-mannose dehydrogenase family protein [Chlamydiota bacterium]